MIFIYITYTTILYISHLIFCNYFIVSELKRYRLQTITYYELQGQKTKPMICDNIVNYEILVFSQNNWLSMSLSFVLIAHNKKRNEPHDKTNKMACAPSEDSNQTGHQSSLFAWRKHGSLATPLSGQRRLLSDWADAQANLSPRLAHNHFVGFVIRRLTSLLSSL